MRKLNSTQKKMIDRFVEANRSAPAFLSCSIIDPAGEIENKNWYETVWSDIELFRFICHQSTTFKNEPIGVIIMNRKQYSQNDLENVAAYVRKECNGAALILGTMVTLITLAIGFIIGVYV
jgi:hypothetical protein